MKLLTLCQIVFCLLTISCGCLHGGQKRIFGFPRPNPCYSNNDCMGMANFCTIQPGQQYGVCIVRQPWSTNCANYVCLPECYNDSDCPRDYTCQCKPTYTVNGVWHGKQPNLDYFDENGCYKKTCKPDDLIDRGIELIVKLGMLERECCGIE